MTWRKLHRPEPDGEYIGLLYFDALTGRFMVENRAGRAAALPETVRDEADALAWLRGEGRNAA